MAVLINYFHHIDPSFQPLPLELSETVSTVAESSRSQESQSLQDKVSDFLARLHQDSINLSLDIPKPRPFPGKAELSGDHTDLRHQERVFTSV